jgi:hypothetical protein
MIAFAKTLQHSQGLWNFVTIEILLYFMGWIVWVPSYVAAVRFLFFKRDEQGKTRDCIIPTIAVCANISFEFLWSILLLTKFRNYGSGFGFGALQFVYVGAFLLDIPILIGVAKYGTVGITEKRKRDCDREPQGLESYMVVAMICAVWLAVYVGLIFSFEVPLGSVGAYLDNAVMSMLFVWRTKFDRNVPASIWLAFSKFFGSFLTTILVAVHYSGTEFMFLYILAGLSMFFDAWYIYYALRNKYESEPGSVRGRASEPVPPSTPALVQTANEAFGAAYV